MAGRRFWTRNTLLTVSGAAVALALIVGALSLALPRFLSRDYDAKSLTSLRKQAVLTRQGFASLLASLESRKARFERLPLPAEAKDAYPLFQKEGLDPETEGIALGNGDGLFEVWYGNVLSLADQVGGEDLEVLKRSGGSFLVRSKASVYLIALQPLKDGGRMLAHFARLAFIPQFQSSHIRESHALRPAFRADFDIDYWDFREDVEGFEKFFGRHKDEFTGQPRQKNEIQTLFFPLRNETGRIMATVTLASPSLTAKLSRAREGLRLVLLLLLFAGGLAAVAFFWSSPDFRHGRDVVSGGLGAALLVGLRLLALPLGHLEKIQSLSLFKPSVAGFSSWGGLTRSPADIFLTSLAALGLASCLAVCALKPKHEDGDGFPAYLGIASSVLAAALAGGGILVLMKVFRHVVFNSNLSLLRWDFDVSRLALQLSLFLFLVAVLIVLAVAFRLALLGSRAKAASGVAVVLAATGAVFLDADRSLFLAAVSAALIAWLFAVAAIPNLTRRREIWFAGLVLTALWMSRSLDGLSVVRTHRLLETTLAHTILTQETWGNFLIEESLPGLDRGERLIVSFFKDPQNSEFAHSLWEKSPVAKFNWYSSLEVRDAEGNTLSRFSLNVPKILGGPPDLEPARDWTIVPYSQTFIGKEKDFLVGYKDYYDGGVRLGRVILYVSLDPEMLPFLYSANPYFEVLRTDSLPSLNQFDFGCEIFDLEGRSLFNPRKLTAGLSTGDLDRLRASSTPFWSELRERGTVYDAYLFRSGERCYSLFSPRKDIKTRAVDFLRFFFLGLAAAMTVLLVVTMASGMASVRKPLWSFSNRVYASFLAVALVPLLLYTVFTRNLFDSLFTERFVEDAAIHASYAQGLMEAFLIIQGIEVSPYLAPSEDLALWISSTLSNDVILYGDAVLLASSRREFFDSGLLPEILDGEAYQALVYDRKPFFTQRTRLGGYSFQTLTVPYDFKNTTLFISLPFPFEKEQLTKATQEIVEFLVLLSAFFLNLVILLSRGIKSMIIVPVRKLLAGTREVGLGNLEVTIEHRSHDEMMTLIDGFNTMIRNLKAHEQELAEMSKKVAWTEMARKVAHEIKNPLTPIQLSAEHVLKVYEDKRGDLDKTLKESMSYIISEVENLRHIAQEFMEIARDTTVRKEPVDLRVLLEETLQPYSRLLAERIRFKVVAEGSDFRASGDAAKLKTAFRNIVANAIEAISQQGDVALSIGRKGPVFTISVRDSGPGMSKETVDRIFDLYFSTKDAGTGLGLPIAKKIVEEHGGAIRVTSEPGKGTTVVIDLPAGE
ncbi:MAG: HAMP domain-containing histidine kinase [Acidobacteria bacterium]|nr:HAMP domain-containing histidine kinase [Acidobacteriota bacterium]